MSGPVITYTPRHDATRHDFTHEAELSTLAALYRFVLDAHAKEKATGAGGLNDAKESDVDCAATKQYTR